MQIIFFKFYFIFKLYIIVLVLPNIKMNPYTCVPHPNSCVSMRLLGVMVRNK